MTTRATPQSSKNSKKSRKSIDFRDAISYNISGIGKSLFPILSFKNLYEVSMQNKNSLKGALLLLLTAVIWGFAFVAQAQGADSVTPFYFNFVRYVLGAVSVVPVFLLFERNANDKKVMKTTIVSGIVTGVFLFLASYLQQVGIEMTDSAGKSGFITGLYMIIVPIIGIFFGKKIKPSTWLGALLGVVGLFLVCMGGGRITFTVGDIFLVGCAVFYAVQILIIDKFGQKVYSIRYACTQFTTAAVLCGICTAVFEDFTAAPFTEALVPILYCGFMSVGVAYTCQILGQKHCEPTSASIIMSTESVFSAIGGAIILNERMESTGYLGCVLIFVGILLSQGLFTVKKSNKSK